MKSQMLETPKLCVPVTDIFRRHQESLLPLVSAVSFKGVSDDFFPEKDQMLECSLNIADPSFVDEMQKAGLLSALQTGRFSSFACDIGPACQYTMGQSSHGYPRYLPCSALMEEESYVEQSRRNVRYLRGYYAGKIKLENLNYFPTGAYEKVCRPDFIRQLISNLSIELLLDVGHLKISSYNLGIPLDRYVQQLPLERVTEIQLSGADLIDGVWEDVHGLPSSEDWGIVETVLSKSPVEYITLEYYKDGGMLVEAYRDLYQRITRT